MRVRSRVLLFETPWAAAHQASLAMGFSWQEYWSRLPFPSSGDLLNPGIKPVSPAWLVDSLPLSSLGSRRPQIEKPKKIRRPLYKLMITQESYQNIMEQSKHA